MANVAQTGLSPLVIDNADGTCTPVVATADTVTIVTVAYYDVSGFLAGEPGADGILLRHVAVRAFTLPEDLTGSEASAAVAADAEAVLSIQLNGVEFGTVTFAIAGDTGTFAAASEQVVEAGDVLSVVAQTVPDADLADISVTLKGTLG